MDGISQDCNNNLSNVFYNSGIVRWLGPVKFNRHLFLISTNGIKRQDIDLVKKLNI